MGKMLLLGVGGIVAFIAVFKILFALLGAALGLVMFVLFKILPLVLIGWLVMKVWRSWRARPVG